MSQNDFDIANQTGAAFRSDLNSALQALVTLSSGASAPSTTYAYMFWADTTTGLLKQRNGANNAWVTLCSLADSTKLEFYVNNTKYLDFDSSGNAVYSATGHVRIPNGTTGQRSGSPALGMIRYNTTLSQFEGYGASGWGAIGGAGNAILDTFSGTGSQTAFTLSSDPGSENNTLVVVSGVVQLKSTYSISGTTLTFASAPPSGTNNIEVTYNSTIAVGTPSDGTITTVKLADGAVTTAKLDSTLRTSIAQTQGFRLTLTSGTPVTTTDVTGATTIYCAPYKGNAIALYDGTNWNIRTSAQFSLALGTITSAKNYDVFCYDNAGTPTLEILAWTNDTTRATALTYQDGVLVKSGATTRRYMGTLRSTSTTTTEDSVTKRFLWNYYHRARRHMKKGDATASWTYTTATFRQANNNAANQLESVIGVAEDSIEIFVNAVASNSTAAVGIGVGVGVNSTTVNSTDSGGTDSGASSAKVQVAAKYTAIPAVGYSYYAWIEFSTATGTTTWQGTNNPYYSFISGSVFA